MYCSVVHKNCNTKYLNVKDEMVGPITYKAFWSSGVVLYNVVKGEIPKHFDMFKSTMSQQHGYNTRNGYMPKISKPSLEWGRNKTYFKAINDWASLLSELKELIPKSIFKHKLKGFYLIAIFNLS